MTSAAAPIALALVAALLTALFTGALIPLLRRRLLDHPNARSSHATPTPRGGGLAFVLVATALAAASGALLPLLCLPLALVGMLDDRHNLPAGLRYGVQAGTAVALVALAPLQLAWWLWPLALVAVTAVINFVNFTDGLDGLVAGCLAVLLAVAAVQLQAGWLWAVVGALLGFLVWNWSPARVFMGDVGSTWLGAIYAAAVLQAPTPSALLGLLLVGFPLLGDACSCVLRRLHARQPIFQAHRLHLYQRLQRAGWPHGRVSGLYVGVTAVLGVAWLVGGLLPLLALVALSAAAGLWLDQRVAAPFRAETRQE
ncbi:glycosyltransferase family 4 protein [Synechococcus sp. ATX 2A4]|uniref:MraY family glycosyltransferase n=1 Tax=Synechococcus sp. ATX 2A4 TaxID=2823727 RepID=UPI0020CD2211|nr:glycosyltransferase family 4 protein [Synechococcus sp. ATX 2A4]MCP9884187.1 glycosyltransferase family 4 protein [Synechococcus sp. ATX 2A4]